MRRILGILIMMIISVTTAMSRQMSVAHGTNALHHTFSPESETFYTTSKTDNLMDYNRGKTLTHTQRQWSHEKHRNVLGFLDDEGEGEAKYWIADDYLQNKKVEIAYWKWQNDGAP